MLAHVCWGFLLEVLAPTSSEPHPEQLQLAESHVDLPQLECREWDPQQLGLPPVDDVPLPELMPGLGAEHVRRPGHVRSAPGNLEEIAVYDNTGRMVRQRFVASWAGETDIFVHFFDHVRASRLSAHSRLYKFTISPSLLVYHEQRDRPNRLHIAVRIPVRSMDFPVFNEHAHVSLAYDAIMDFEVPCRRCVMGGIANDSFHVHCDPSGVMCLVLQPTCCRLRLRAAPLHRLHMLRLADHVAGARCVATVLAAAPRALRAAEHAGSHHADRKAHAMNASTFVSLWSDDTCDV